jgi:hypothetical protein
MSDLPSYRKIDYTIRPAKNIERKMIAEACACLSAFSRVSFYRYIGLGSIFFSDFTLFHRALGFKNMISIEKEVEDSDRFKFNKPLGCIEIEFGDSGEVLSTIKWHNIPTVIWLDYDRKIDVDKLNDIGYVVANLCPPSMLIVTLRAVADDFGVVDNRLATLQEELGDKLPYEIQTKDLVEARFPTVVRNIVHENISLVMNQRNAGLPAPNHFEYRQIFNFVYSDGTMMVTIGGVIFQKGQVPMFDRCDFSSLEFCKSGEESYHIRAPSLTFREQRCLDSQFPSASARCPRVPDEDILAYARLYRYFPKFVEAEL